uniref:Uncharacterized protein n=1 Tax=Panagrolaimus sp. ES5 TaxID=591445 RepID=A0AC34FCE7_9BILA
MDSLNSTIMPSDKENSVTCKLGVPESILYYIKNQAQPKFQLKLMKTSKYFRYKDFPFCVTREICYGDDTWFFLQNDGTYEDLKILTKPLWITGSIELINVENAEIISDLLSKAVVCDIKKLACDEILTLDQFNMLTSSKNFEKLYYYHSDIEHDVGSVISFDEIIKLSPKLKELEL